MNQERNISRWARSVGVAQAITALTKLVAPATGKNTGVFITDRDRKVVSWDAGMEQLLGFSADEIVDEHCLKGNRCSNCMAGCGLERLGSVAQVPLTLFHKDGSKVHLYKTGSAFFDADGSFLGTIEVMSSQSIDDHTDARPQPPRRDAPIAEDTAEFHGMLTRNKEMMAMFETIKSVAQTTSPVLARGESGTGKDLLARAIHLESERADKPFVLVNCAALSPTLLESQLFGHTKGAFTGATSHQPGVFALADGGTLFLDEVAEIPLELQAKLLRALESGEISPMGSAKTSTVDVRIVAATHRSLRAEVRAGTFRQDLMFRLRVVPLFLSPLRDRREDIALLLWRFIAQHNTAGRRVITEVLPAAMRLLLDHAWDGNVRELQNVVQYAFAVGRGHVLLPSELPPEFREAVSRSGARGPNKDDERGQIIHALDAAQGNITKAADLLGMSRATFWRKRKKHHI